MSKASSKSVSDFEANNTARDSILGSIREHLAASAPHDAIYAEKAEYPVSDFGKDIVQENGYRRSAFAREQELRAQTSSLIEIFRDNLEAVGGHCIVVRSEAEATRALSRIISELQETHVRARRIALSNSPAVERVFKDMQVEVDQVAVDPGAAALFGYDVGVSTAQSAIAETGTLVLESEAERHRLVSLVPPVHIAIVEADKICLTLGEALAKVNRGSELSPTITLITGPSRTADIELTLAIGVHGPQELYVVVNEGSPLKG